MLLRHAENTLMARQLATGIRSVSDADRVALLGMIQRDAPLPRGTAVEVKGANMVAQREKRARDRLRKAILEKGGIER
jgi:hypothetical protein